MDQKKRKKKNKDKEGVALFDLCAQGPVSTVYVLEKISSACGVGKAQEFFQYIGEFWALQL